MKWYQQNANARGDIYKVLANTIKTRQATDTRAWSNGSPSSVLFEDLDPRARAAYNAAVGPIDRYGRPGYDAEDLENMGAQDNYKNGFAIGISGKTGAFVKEGLTVAKKSGQGENNGPTKKGGKATRTKKTIKRAAKKTPKVNRKDIRKAIKSEGITNKDKKVYSAVRRATSPKLAQNLKKADRRNDRTGPRPTQRPLKPPARKKR